MWAIFLPEGVDEDSENLRRIVPDTRTKGRAFLEQELSAIIQLSPSIRAGFLRELSQVTRKKVRSEKANS